MEREDPNLPILGIAAFGSTVVSGQQRVAHSIFHRPRHVVLGRRVALHVTAFKDQPSSSPATVTKQFEPLNETVSVPGIADSTTATTPSSSTRASGKREYETINWFKYWWPVVPLAQLDPKVPQAIDLLGMSLVVWQDSKGTWHAMRDRCPHRLAPLSEGRVMGDDLMCSYHGWRFNGGGSCTFVPQIEDPKAQATALASKRNCVDVFPTKVVHELLWIWPEAGPAGAAAAAAVPTPVTAIPSLLEAEADPQGSIYFRSTAWFMRDMPLRFDTLVENVVDPSHIYFAHHGVPGLSMDKMINPVMVLKGNQISAEGGFTVARDAVQGRHAAPASEFGFLTPNLSTYRYPYSESHFYCIPTRPGWSRIITCIVGRKDAEMPGPIKFMSKLVSRWPVLEHVLIRHPVLDGDLYMLHAGERALVREGNNPRTYYMPANADLSVAAWRRWLERHGGEVPTLSKEDIAKMPPLMPKEQALNRYEQHTSKCRTCQAALKQLEFASKLAGAVAAVLGILTLSRLAAVGLGPFLSSPLYLVAGLVSGLAGVLCAGLARAREEFFYRPYVHALRE